MAPKPLQVLSEKGGGGYITEGNSLYIGYNVWGIALMLSVRGSRCKNR